MAFCWIRDYSYSLFLCQDSTLFIGFGIGEISFCGPFYMVAYDDVFFVVGLPKCGTTSLDESFKAAGMVTAHWITPHAVETLCD